MRKVMVTILTAALLSGPLSAVAQAGKMCDLQKKLGVVYIKECEDVV